MDTSTYKARGKSGQDHVSAIHSNYGSLCIHTLARPAKQASDEWAWTLSIPSPWGLHEDCMKTHTVTCQKLQR